MAEVETFECAICGGTYAFTVTVDLTDDEPEEGIDTVCDTCWDTHFVEIGATE